MSTGYKQKDLRRMQAQAEPASQLANSFHHLMQMYALIKPTLHSHAAWIDKVRFEGALLDLENKVKQELDASRKASKP